MKTASGKKACMFGYQALMQGKVVAVPVIMNKMLANSVWLMPCAWVRNIVRKLQDK
jgi:hypothetical protein